MSLLPWEFFDRNGRLLINRSKLSMHFLEMQKEYPVTEYHPRMYIEMIHPSENIQGATRYGAEWQHLNPNMYAWSGDWSTILSPAELRDDSGSYGIGVLCERGHAEPTFGERVTLLFEITDREYPRFAVYRNKFWRTHTSDKIVPIPQPALPKKPILYHNNIWEDL